MKRKPTRAALHRLIEIDTRIGSAECQLTIAQRIDPRALRELGIADLPELCARLTAHLETLRDHMLTMFDEPYPQQPGAPLSAPRDNT